MPCPTLKLSLRLALAGVAGVELQDAVLHFEAGEALAHRLLVEHLQVEPAAADHAFGRSGERAGVGAVDGQHRR